MGQDGSGDIPLDDLDGNAVANEDLCRLGGEVFGKEAGIVSHQDRPPPPHMVRYGLGDQTNIGKGELITHDCPPAVGAELDLVHASPSLDCRSLLTLPPIGPAHTSKLDPAPGRRAIVRVPPGPFP